MRGVRGSLLGIASRTLRGVTSGKATSAPLLLGHLLDIGVWWPRLLKCCCCAAGCCRGCCSIKLDRLSLGILVVDPMAPKGLQFACSCCWLAPAGLPMPMPAWSSFSSGTWLGLLAPALLPLDLLPRGLLPDCCSVAMVAVKADGDADDPSGAAPPVLLSTALTAAGGDTALLGMAFVAAAALPLLLSPAAALVGTLVVPADTFLPAGASLFARVAAVALNSVGLGAGSLNTAGFVTVRADCCCCLLSLHLLSFARISASAALGCVVTAAVRSALNAPGRSAVRLGLLIAADMLKVWGVCIDCCLLCSGAAVPGMACVLLAAVLKPAVLAAGGPGVTKCWLAA